MPAIPEWKRPAQPSLVLRLWDGAPTVPAVYVATAHADGRPGYALRRFVPDWEQPLPPPTVADAIALAAQTTL
jgi:hypothetical protein